MIMKTLWKLWNFFIIVLVYMHWLYIFALCLLIWLMTTKNIYSRINNVCLGGGLYDGFYENC